ncbi:Indigoidine synthase A like protein-domain-containing protein [Diplogelasinospora grovesii]|uniref:Indigoidine synthase A like protein-domain-containing protein n=1 Tax=Diplogelasinospora grovesii TaxID=303347 RepID=A0AAN6S756_9PEZI|nr:Indigoidine synthase A like protein-domain-containing protein [Diplogelasinospora grovesii]
MATIRRRSVSTLSRLAGHLGPLLNRVSRSSSRLICDPRWRHHRCFTAQASQHTSPIPADLLKVSEEVADAIATNRPVVALESTIYTHGALGHDLLLEDIVRKHGAVPAVCGVLAGVPTVGLSTAEVERMVEEGAKKVSRRDLAYLVGMGLAGHKMHGGTTISGTMILARAAGIRVFGTGGLGGVHRGGENSMDISADLTELGRTSVAVVSSGCKGFLDIPRTLEFLETQGCLVSTFGEGKDSVDFPAFWARESGCKSPSVHQTEAQAAAMILAQERLGVESGLLFGNPIPEEHAIPREEMDAAINTAVREADEKGFSGNQNTPYILKRIRELTQGRSVPANKALVQANVAKAAGIAVELSRLLDGTPTGLDTSYTVQVPSKQTVKIEISSQPAVGSQSTHTADILVAGSVALDLSCDYYSGSTTSVSPQLHTSNPAAISQSVGGVGHNVALAAHKITGGEANNNKVRLCSMIGDDIAGSTILSHLQSEALDTCWIRQLRHAEYHSTRTAQYVAVNDADKNLVLAMADMAIFTSHSFPAYWQSAVAAAKPRWLVVDGNWSEQDLPTWLRAAREHKAKVAFEPVSTAKSERLFPPKPTTSSKSSVFPKNMVDLATPNQYELASMYVAALRNGYFESPEWFAVIDAFGMHGGARGKFVRITGAEMTDAGVPQQSIQLLPYIPTIITKLGSKGCLVTMILKDGDPKLRDPEHAPYVLTRNIAEEHPHLRVGGVYMRLFPAVEKVKQESIVSVNGVGDTFLGVLVAGLAQGGRVENLIDVAQKAAVLTLKSHKSVSDELGALGKELERAAAKQ